MLLEITITSTDTYSDIANTIIVICMIAVASYWINGHIQDWLETRKYYKDIARLYMSNHSLEKNLSDSESMRFIDKSSSYFKRHPEEFKVAEKEYLDHQKQLHKEEEHIKRELIKKRVFLYDYEDMLCQIYAPTAKREYSKTWKSTGLERDYIIKRIGEIRGISKEESEKLFNLFIEKEILAIDYNDKIELCRMLNSGDSYLNDDWKVVTDTDINLSRWMVEHGYYNENY